MDTHDAQAGIAVRLKTLREKSGLDPAALADQIGVSPAWFDDMERDDEELFNGLDLEQVRKIALLLGAGTAQLLTGAPVPPGIPPLTFLELSRKLKARIDEEADPVSGLEAWEEKTGWELGRFLKSPSQEGWSQPPAFFHDSCRALRIDWQGILAFCDALPEEG